MDPTEVNMKLDKRFREEEVKSSVSSEENEAVRANLKLEKLLDSEGNTDEGNVDEGFSSFYMNNNTPAIKINKKNL